MGLKKNPTTEEVEDIKKLLDFITEEESIMELVAEVKDLRLQNAEKEKRIAYLESRVADLEQYSRINDVIVTGLKINPRSYAQAVATDNGGEPGELDANSMEKLVANFLQSKGIELDCSNIEAYHPLPRRNARDRPAVILRFANRKHKIALLKHGRKLKGTDVFINEHLAKHNADIATRACQLKKQRKIQNTWTSNCKVFIKLNGAPEEAKVICIRNIMDLDKFQ
ncbi:hypothetical protein ABVT39_009825 [Epinephelus coioides]